MQGIMQGGFSYTTNQQSTNTNMLVISFRNITDPLFLLHIWLLKMYMFCKYLQSMILNSELITC